MREKSNKKEIETGAPGILDARHLPDEEFDNLWDAIILDAEIKNRVLSQAILNFSLRPRVPRSTLPLHGIILLTGAPGTGKTSLARGLASMVAKSFRSSNFLFLEVEPHALTSSALGKSQRAVTELLSSTVAEHAATRPVIVLLDEVETLASDRSKLSLEANPVDVHRTTDAVLAQLDHLAAKFPQLLFIATSNFAQAIDEAFVSRADLTVEIGKPNAEACRAILTETVEGLAAAFPPVKAILKERDFESAVRLSQGLDGRKLRKLVAAACTFEKETAINPALLTAKDILRAVEHERNVAGLSKGAGK